MKILQGNDAAVLQQKDSRKHHVFNGYAADTAVLLMHKPSPSRCSLRDVAVVLFYTAWSHPPLK